MIRFRIISLKIYLKDTENFLNNFSFGLVMTLKFCKKCKTLLRPHKREGKIFLECSNCNYSEIIDRDNHLVTSEKIKKPKKVGEGSVREEDIFATYNHICKKCGYDKAEVIDVGIFYSDEDNLIMLKCGKCGYSERVGKKTS